MIPILQDVFHEKLDESLMHSLKERQVLNEPRVSEYYSGCKAFLFMNDNIQIRLRAYIYLFIQDKKPIKRIV